jgi:hypothetical protein
MTIKREKGSEEYVVHCDECPEYLETECDDFRAARESAQEQGWRTFKGPDGLWANACATCVEKFAKEKRR